MKTSFVLSKYVLVHNYIDLKCPKPRTLTNGRRVVEGKKFNETATFTCNAGYTLIGASVRTCRGKGVWDGLEPICGKLKSINCQQKSTSYLRTI